VAPRIFAVLHLEALPRDGALPFVRHLDSIMSLTTLLTMITFQVGVNHRWDGSSISRYLEASLTLICPSFLRRLGRRPQPRQPVRWQLIEGDPEHVERVQTRVAFKDARRSHPHHARHFIFILYVRDLGS
jgi:hypothetical protein